MTPQPTAVRHRITLLNGPGWSQATCACDWDGDLWRGTGGAIAASNEGARHLELWAAGAEAAPKPVCEVCGGSGRIELRGTYMQVSGPCIACDGGRR